MSVQIPLQYTQVPEYINYTTTNRCDSINCTKHDECQSSFCLNNLCEKCNSSLMQLKCPDEQCFHSDQCITQLCQYGKCQLSQITQCFLANASEINRCEFQSCVRDSQCLEPFKCQNGLCQTSIINQTTVLVMPSQSEIIQIAPIIIMVCSIMGFVVTTCALFLIVRYLRNIQTQQRYIINTTDVSTVVGNQSRLQGNEIQMTEQKFIKEGQFAFPVIDQAKVMQSSDLMINQQTADFI
ncbi:hypothetical protein FGO68_gene13937 [Halteria grandinella]|uniref:Transmembrane protein n=1 Tax=Halteria grandinella TaxID=5974 RepID=A0A8J8T708_HALGN|nr:hypothetical protein FGO68_gene13937 [Halteria grandinella]